MEKQVLSLPVQEMTVAEIEAFERCHRIPRSYAYTMTRRAQAGAIDAAARACRAERGAA